MLISSHQFWQAKVKVSWRLYRETDLIANFDRVSIVGLVHDIYDQSVEQGATIRDQDNDMSMTTVAFGQFFDGTGLKLRSLSEYIDYLKDHRLPLSNRSILDELPRLRSHPLRLNLTARDVTRWKMAWQAIQACKIVDRQNPRGEKISRRPEVKLLAGLLTGRCRDWPDFEEMFDQIPITLGFCITAFIYGGLHALAWSAPFPSVTEELLWKICACIVMGGLPIFFALYAVAAYLQVNYDVLWREAIHNWITIPLLIPSLLLIIMAYTLARAYLVVECFINLSHLPAGVYDVPKWSAYFPHIS